MTNPFQIYVPVTAQGTGIYDNAWDLVARCKNPAIAKTIAEAINRNAQQQRK